MKFLFYFLSFFLFPLYITAQTPTITWQKSLGGTGSDESFIVEQTTDGGYIIAGYSNSTDGDVTGNQGYNDYWVVKLDDLGSIMWEKSYGGSAQDNAYSIQQTIDGGYIVAGQTNSHNGDVTGGYPGGYDYWVIKLDSVGNISWDSCYGGNANDHGRMIQQTNDGGYILAGHSYSTDGDVSGNHGGLDIWIVKIDALGGILWEKSLGGSIEEDFSSIQQTSDGGYVLTGFSNSTDGDLTSNQGGYDYWIVKLDSIGNLTWQKSYGGSLNDRGTSIQETTDKGYIVAGETASNDGDVSGSFNGSDYWVIKLDSIGNLTWQKPMGGSTGDWAWDVQQSNDGGYIVIGQSTSTNGNVTGNHGGNDYWLAKLDSTGWISWQKTYGGSSDDIPYSFKPTTDGGYIATGVSKSNDGDVSGNHGDNDIWVVKFSAAAVFGTDTQYACDSLFWIDGNTYTTTTNTPTYNIIGGAVNGYDSIVTLNLTVSNLSASFNTVDNGNGNYTFTNTSTGNSNQVHWAFGDGVTSTLNSPNHTFNANGTYVVVLTINDSTVGNSCIDYYLDTIIVSGVPTPSQCVAGYVMYPDSGNVSVINSSTGNNLSYLWDFGDGDTSSLAYPTHIYSANGPYYLCLTIDDGAGCIDMYCDSIGVNGVVFSKQSGFTINVIASPVITDIETYDKYDKSEHLNIYPNPSNDLITMEVGSNLVGSFYSIYNTMSKKVMNGQIISNKIIIDLRNLSNGIYLIKVNDNNQTYKIIKN